MSESDKLVADFERAIENARSGKYLLKLFVSGSSDRSARAITNIRSICEEYLSGRYELEVVDLYQQPHLARQDRILAAPTLIKELPEPVRRVVGDMSDEGRVLVGLDIGWIT